MMRRPPSRVRAVHAVAAGSASVLMWALAAQPAVAAGNYPVTPQQRATAQQVAQAGVPLSELAPNAPDSHTVKSGDTLWDISRLFLKSPWRWPELWGMNLDQIRNPHLIYPGQVLVLEKVDGRARLRLADGSGGTTGTVKLSPRIRSDLNESNPISGVPLHLIQPFLNDAVVFDTDELAAAPRIVAAQEGRVMLSRGDTAYVRGELNGQREFRVFRTAKPLLDPTTREILGYEAPFVGTADFVRAGGTTDEADGGKTRVVPDTFVLSSIREEVGVGDRLAPVPPRDFSTYAPHAPGAPMSGRIISIYGDALNAGQNQIVALNRGARDGVERGHVLALWRNGADAVDRTDGSRTAMKLPDERHGMLFVFRVFERVSYALILTVQEPVKAGDRFTQP
ncbi:LysM peptidoglycan-binding domain-containing protein [Ideonella sp. BN130291]|uniref:LysM peptidoglycan-binding domain-containing protein n=1 Tax=Ideonella sp. BN130291 TaxID=3112940 RepID=UPI003FA5C389